MNIVRIMVVGHNGIAGCSCRNDALRNVYQNARSFSNSARCPLGATDLLDLPFYYFSLDVQEPYHGTAQNAIDRTMLG